MTDCIFCKIIAGDIPSTKLYEDDKVLCFLDINPINPGHTLVIPKEHCEFLSEMSADCAHPMWETGRKIATALRNADIRCESVNFLLADGPAAGQEVPHVHLHVIPRYQDDKSGFIFPFDRKIPEGDDWNRIAESIRKNV